jgi:hypothetical protein
VKLLTTVLVVIMEGLLVQLAIFALRELCSLHNTLVLFTLITLALVDQHTVTAKHAQLVISVLKVPQLPLTAHPVKIAVWHLGTLVHVNLVPTLSVVFAIPALQVNTV